MVLSSDDTMDGTSALPSASRMTTGTPSFTKATRLLVVPRSIPTTLLIPNALPLRSRKGDGGHGILKLPVSSVRSSVLRGSRFFLREFSFDPREQVVDVIALEHPLPQRFKDRASLRL